MKDPVSIHCPECDVVLEWKDVAISGSFPCSKCGCHLEVPPSYRHTIVWPSLTIGGAIAFMFDLRGEALMLWSVLLAIPVGAVILDVVHRRWPPKVRLS